MNTIEPDWEGAFEGLEAKVSAEPDWNAAFEGLGTTPTVAPVAATHQAEVIPAQITPPVIPAPPEGSDEDFQSAVQAEEVPEEVTDILDTHTQVREIEQAKEFADGYKDIATTRWAIGKAQESMGFSAWNYINSGDSQYLDNIEDIQSKLPEADILTGADEAILGHSAQALPMLLSMERVKVIQEGIKKELTTLATYGEDKKFNPLVLNPHLVLGAVARGALKGATFDYEYQMSAGLNYLEMSKIEGLDPELAIVAAKATATVQSATSLVGDVVLAKLVPGSAKLGKDLIMRSATKVLKSKVMVRFASQYVGVVATGTAEEMAQKAEELLGTEIIKEYSNQLRDTDIPHADKEYLVEQMKAEFIPALSASVGLSAGVSVAGMTSSMAVNKAAQMESRRKINSGLKEMHRLAVLKEQKVEAEAGKKDKIFEIVPDETPLDEVKHVDTPVEKAEKANTELRIDNAVDNIIHASDENIDEVLVDELFTAKGERSGYSKTDLLHARNKKASLKEMRKMLNAQKRESIKVQREAEPRSEAKKEAAAKVVGLRKDLVKNQRELVQVTDTIERITKPVFLESDKALIYGMDALDEAKGIAFQGFIDDGKLTQEDVKTFNKSIREARLETRRAKMQGNLEGYRKGKAEVRRNVMRGIAKRKATVVRNKVSRSVKQTIEKGLKKTKDGVDADTQQLFSGLNRRIDTVTAKGKKVRKRILDLSQKQARAELTQQSSGDINEIVGVEEQLAQQLLVIKADGANVSINDLKALDGDLKEILVRGQHARLQYLDPRALRRKAQLDGVLDEILPGEGDVKARLDSVKSHELHLEKDMTKMQAIGSELEHAYAQWGADLISLADIIAHNAKNPMMETKTTKVFETLQQENMEAELNRRDAELAFGMVAKRYGIKRKGKNAKKFYKEVELKTWKDVNALPIATGVKVDGGEVRANASELRSLFMQWKSPEIKERLVAYGYTQQSMDALAKHLDPKDFVLIDDLLRFYKWKFNPINEVYSSLNGPHLGRPENYSPIATLRGLDQKTDEAGRPVNLFMEDHILAATAEGHKQLMERKGGADIMLVSDLGMLKQYTDAMNHYVAFAEKIQDINSVINDPSFQKAVQISHGYNKGNALMQILDKHVRDVALGSTVYNNNIKIIDMMRKTYTVATLALRPIMTIKQWTSYLAFAEPDGMTMTDLHKGVVEFLESPVENARFMNEISDYIRNRGLNMDRDLSESLKTDYFATRKGSKLAEGKFRLNQLANESMGNVTFGDKGAIYAGSFALYKFYLKQGYLPKAAIAKVEIFAKMTQQSSAIADQSGLQRGGSMAKVATMYSSALFAMERKQINAFRMYRAGRISKKQFGKTLAIYRVLIPGLFAAVGMGLRLDQEDVTKEIFAAMLIGSTGSIPLGGEAVETIVRKGLHLPQFTQGSALNRPMRKMMEFTAEAVDGEMDMRDAAEALQLVLPIPSKYLYDLIESGVNISEGDLVLGIYEAFGISPYTAEHITE